MKKIQLRKKMLLRTLNLFVISSMILSLFAFVSVNEVVAAGNLIKEGSFENLINTHWGTWKDESSSRTYELYRAYDAPFGYGSYSAAIDAKGAPQDAFTAVMSSNNVTNKFAVNSAKKYLLIFYARATANMDLIAYLQKADTHDAISGFYAKPITDKWQKHVVNVSPTGSADALLAFVYGNMPANATLYLDGIQLVESDNNISTTEVKGFVGETKLVNISNIGNFSDSDIEIELPYFDKLTNNLSSIKNKPSRVTSSGVYFQIQEGTYSGLGKVYINSNYIGSFDYNVQIKISAIHPELVRVGEDVVVTGSGFMPLEKNSTSLVVNTINSEGKVSQSWVKPETMDSSLKQMSFKLPAGTVAGGMYVQTSFFDAAGLEKINKSNSIAYKIKPVVTATEWSQRGYEHVGDNLTIYGKGLGTAPSVNFYDSVGNKLETKKAKIVSVGELEKIEVVTTKKSNSFDITIISNGVESDRSEFLAFLAKPKILTVMSSRNRTVYTGSEKIAAAKIGEEITINGEGFKAADGIVNVEFQGNNKRINVRLSAENIVREGTTLRVAVPVGAQNGYFNVKVNGQDSNYIALEIIPTVIAVSPNPVVPGADIRISANGVSDNLELCKVNFKLTNTNEISVAPYAIDLSGDTATVYVKAPMAISSSNTKVGLQYDRWSDDGTSVLNVRPHVDSASINMENKVLSIKGYGFSINPKENVITYKYNDETKTVITPNVRMLGVYPTEDGQEIRIQILDGYRYGFVSVQVGEFVSNEVGFGETMVSNIARRVEFVKSENKVMGVLYISGYNFGPKGKVTISSREAATHYRSNFFIIAVIDKAYVNDNPVVVTRE